LSTNTQAINLYTLASWIDTRADLLDVIESADEDAVTHLYYAPADMRDQLRDLELNL
jgi:hypothetical protein